MRRNAHLYVMRNEHGHLKLGHSVNPLQRSRSLGSPQIVFCSGIIDEVERVEKLAHRLLVLSGKHLKGEWFEASLEDAMHAIEVATKQAEKQELELGGKMKNMGRPKGSGEYEKLVHVRLSTELMGQLEAIRSSQLDRPPVSVLIRRAIADFVKRGGAP